MLLRKFAHVPISGSHLIRLVNQIEYLIMRFIFLLMFRQLHSYYNIGDRGNGSFKQLNELYAGNGMIGYVAKECVYGKLLFEFYGMFVMSFITALPADLGFLVRSMKRTERCRRRR